MSSENNTKQEDASISSENNAKQEISDEFSDAKKSAQELYDLLSADGQKLHNNERDRLNRQWISLIIVTLLAIAVVPLVMWFAFSHMRAPEHGEQLAALDKATQQLQFLATALADSSAGCAGPEQQKICEDAKIAIGKYTADYKKVSDALVLNDQQPKPEAIAISQLVGGTAILALLGYLGLMRLQNLDVEINNLRSFMYEQIAIRIKELTETVKHDVVGEIRDEIKKAQAKANGIKEDILATATINKENTKELVRDTLAQIQNMRSDLEATLAKYPWLDKAALGGGLTTDISSVEKAHQLATELTAQGDEETALTILEAIVVKNLPGDKADFHNSYSQCVRLNNPTLALTIVEAGLKLFPYDYDLMADKAQALDALGRPLEAQKLLEDWFESKPGEFARGWRPIVFYAKVVQASEMESGAVGKLIIAFESVVSHAQYESKAWSAYGRFLEKLGKIAEAEGVLQRGIRYNPFSQELNFVLGEFYLRTGKAKNAVAKLEIAARCDYQSQYQPDVAPNAVLCTLAQAYEATNKPDRAVKLYQSLIEQGATGYIRRYAQQRLQMLSALGLGDGDTDTFK